jgi:hypothetical protein
MHQSILIMLQERVREKSFNCILPILVQQPPSRADSLHGLSQASSSQVSSPEALVKLHVQELSAAD